MGSIMLDDRDSRIRYSSTGWRYGTMNLNSEYMSTTTVSNVSMAEATVTFTGTRIDFIATLAIHEGYPARYTFTLDQQSPVSYDAPFVGQATYQNRIYRSPSVPYGQHSLRIVNHIPGGRLVVDAFEVWNPDPPPPASTPTPQPQTSDTPPPPSEESQRPTENQSETAEQPSTEAGLSTAASTASEPSPRPASPSGVQATDSSTRTDNSNKPENSVVYVPTPGEANLPSHGGNGDSVGTSHRGVDSAVIVGGVIAGIVVVCLMILGVVYARRRRLQRKLREAANYSHPPPSESEAGGPTPQPMAEVDKEYEPSVGATSFGNGVGGRQEGPGSDLSYAQWDYYEAPATSRSRLASQPPGYFN